METFITILAAPYLILGYLFWVMVIGAFTPMGLIASTIALTLLFLLRMLRHKHRIIKWCYWGFCIFIISYASFVIYMVINQTLFKE